jgi:hypothetical protein
LKGFFKLIKLKDLLRSDNEKKQIFKLILVFSKSVINNSDKILKKLSLKILFVKKI